MTIDELVANVADGVSMGMIGETTVRTTKIVRALRAQIPSLNFYAGGRTILVYKPYSRAVSKSKMGKPFFLYCNDLFLSTNHKRNYVDYNDFASHADEAEKILMKYYHVDEELFALAEENPYVLLPVCIDWHKVARELGHDFTGVSPVSGMRRTEIEGRVRDL